MQQPRLSYETFKNSPELAGVLPDHLIEKHIFIDPMCSEQVTEVAGRKVVSYGMSSGGYDIRVGTRFMVFSNVYCGRVDPMNFDPRSLVEINLVTQDNQHTWEKVNENWFMCAKCGRTCTNIQAYGKGDCIPQSTGQIIQDYIEIPPNSYALAESVEELEIPRDIMVIAVGKSTYARCGIIVNVTPVEPEWRGKLTIEISNATPLPAVIYGNQGICQLIFFRMVDYCRVSYTDRKKQKYQNQTGLTLPIV